MVVVVGVAMGGSRREYPTWWTGIIYAGCQCDAQLGGVTMYKVACRRATQGRGSRGPLAQRSPSLIAHHPPSILRIPSLTHSPRWSPGRPHS